MMRSTAALLLVLVGAVCLACAGRPAVDATSTTPVSPSLAASTYYEDGTQVAVIVGVRPTSSRHQRAYIPLEIAVVNKGFATVTLTPASFLLIDVENNRYPVAAPADLSRGYGSTEADRKRGEVEPILQRKYGQYRRVPSNLTRSVDDPVGATPVVLHRFEYLVDLVYFPNPSVPTPKGPFDLLVWVSELPDPLLVRFWIGQPR